MTQQEQEFTKKMLKITYGKALTYAGGVIAVCFCILKTGVTVSLIIVASRDKIIQAIEAEHNTNAVQTEQITNLKVTTDMHSLQIDNLRNR